MQVSQILLIFLRLRPPVDVHFHLWHYFEMSCYKIEILRKPRLLTEQNERLLFEISSGQSYHNNATKMFWRITENSPISTESNKLHDNLLLDDNNTEPATPVSGGCRLFARFASARATRKIMLPRTPKSPRVLKCSIGKVVSTDCGLSARFPVMKEIIPIPSCSRDVTMHLKSVKVSSSSVMSEES